MAISFIRYNMISRSTGKNAVASAAYRSGSRLRDHQSGKLKNYTRKKEVRYSEIDLPRNCTAKYRDREELWNAVEQQSHRKDARLARELIIALPVELDLATDIRVLQKYVQDTFVNDGMIADWSIHMKNDNPHAHVMLTVKPLAPNGETFIGQKTSTFKLDENGNRIPRLGEDGKQLTDAHGRKKWVRTNTTKKNWDAPENGDKWKQSWVDTLAAETGIQIKFGTEPGMKAEKHEGRAARQLEERGEKSAVCEYNRQIRRYNRAVKAQKELERKEKQLQEQSIATMEDVVADIFDEIQDPVKKYNVVTQLSKAREIPHLYDIYGKYRHQLDDYVAQRPKLQSRQPLQNALIAVKAGAKEYQKTLYLQLSDDQRQQVTPPEIANAPKPKQHEQPATDFTAAPPKKKRHGHGRKPIVNTKKIQHEIDRQAATDKQQALADYNETQRKIQQEQWRMQHRSDWDMD